MHSCCSMTIGRRETLLFLLFAALVPMHVDVLPGRRCLADETASDYIDYVGIGTD
jgi:hypothetical protein